MSRRLAFVEGSGDALMRDIYERSGARKWGVPPERFEAAVHRSVDHRFTAEISVSDETLVAYVRSLHVEDLALACACRDGSIEAWDHFAGAFLPRLRAFARGVAGEAGVELADELLADLYGTTIRDEQRRSLFDYFHGRSRLTTWLRTVIGQRHVDALRAAARFAGPEAPDGDAENPVASSRGIQPAASELAAVLAVDRQRVLGLFERELTRAVRGLPSPDRLRLAYYYVQGLKLAHIGRLMGEHESSVSRKLERTRQLVRGAVEEALRAQHGFSEADLRQCLDEAGDDGSLNVGMLLEDRADDR